METLKENPKQKEVTSHVNKLPVEIVGRFLQKLSVGDRLKNGRVSPRWNWSLFKWGWTEQRKLDANIVFEKATAENIVKFWRNLGEDNCQLIALFHYVGKNLIEVNLDSFEQENFERFVPKIAESLHLLPKPGKLAIRDFNLRVFIDYLPPTLRELKTSGRMSTETLEMLTRRCPNLEEITHQYLDIVNTDLETLLEIIGTFSRLKRLMLRSFSFQTGHLASIGHLKALEELDLLFCYGLDGESLGAIVEGCRLLRSFHFSVDQLLTEAALFQLAKMPSLTVLEVFPSGVEFSDAVLKAIAQRGQLNRLHVYGYNSESITDNGIEYLIDHCKSLVSLFFFMCPRITERSLEAVVTQVQRRHGWPPRTLPSGPLDEQIFYIRAGNQELIGNNPWLIFGYDPREII